MNMKQKQQGFTLLELLVVVSVLATMASIAAVAIDGYEQTAEEELVHVEMKNISSAIYRFKQDTGYYPREGVFDADQLYGSSSGAEKTQYNKDENLFWLFSMPLIFDTDDDGDVDVADGDPQERMPWNADAHRGWHGPYLELDSLRSVVINNAICALGETNFDTGFDGNEAAGVLDRYERKIDGSSESCSALNTSAGWVKREYSGQVYQYQLEYKNDLISDCEESTANGCLALVSSGSDSTFDTDDDLVHVLRVNP